MALKIKIRSHFAAVRNSQQAYRVVQRGTRPTRPQQIEVWLHKEGCMNTKDTDRSHDATPLGDGKHKPTGLKEEALKDWNKRLIVNTERPHDGGR